MLFIIALQSKILVCFAFVLLKGLNRSVAIWRSCKNEKLLKLLLLLY